MSKWGLLRGAGQGVAQAGNMLMADRLDQMKEERLQKYQQGMQEKQFAREDTIRAQDTAQRNTERAEDRSEREQSEVRQITMQANARVQDQANADRQFEVSNSLVNKQIEQINQEIDINGMEIDKQRDIKSVWDKIQDTEDPAQLETLFDRYRRLTGTDKDDKYSLHSNPEFDPTTGERIGTSMYTHNSRTNEITPYMGGETQARPSLAELLGGAADNAAQPADATEQLTPVRPTNPGGGLLTQQEQTPASPEREQTQALRDQQREQMNQRQAQQREQSERESFDAILGRVNQSTIRDVEGRTPPNAGALRRNVIAHQEDLLKIIESPVSTDIQKDQARQLLQTISGR